MSSAAQEKAALVNGPVVAADATGRTGVARIAITGSAQSVAIPTELKGKWVDLFVTADVQYGFSTVARTLALNATAALGTGGATVGKTLVANADKPTRIPNDAAFLNFIGTTGFIEIVCTESTSSV